MDLAYAGCGSSYSRADHGAFSPAVRGGEDSGRATHRTPAHKSTPPQLVGVLLFNLSLWEAAWPHFVAYGASRRFAFSTREQTWLNKFFSRDRAHVCSKEGAHKKGRQPCDSLLKRGGV